MLKKLTLPLIIAAIMSLFALPAGAQTPEAIPLRVEAAATGQVTAAAPNALYSFNVIESTRMGFIMDKTAGDMDLTLVVYAQDGTTVLAGSTGTNNNGVIVTFPSTGAYSLSITGENGTSADYRLFIDADPALPIDAFVVQSYVVRGTATTCAENEPAVTLTATEDLGVCFALALVSEPTEFTAQWWSPEGKIISEETATFDSSLNMQPYLTGLVYNSANGAFASGWWQVHFLLNGELSHIQWVYVQ